MLDQYAEMIVRDAVSLRPGQDLFLRGPAVLHDFALCVGEAAYLAGARSVHYCFPDPDEIQQMLRVGSPEQITIYHEGIQEFFAEIVKRSAASICLVHHTKGYPWMEESKRLYPENFQFFIQGMSRLHMAFFDQHMRQRRFPHSTVPVATETWAELVFPDVDEPLESLWQIITRATDGFEERRAVLESRKHWLNSLDIRELHITGGGGNDLRLCLSEKALWHHAALQTKYGQVSWCNFPSDEIFTTPDCRLTEGRFVASKPLRLFNHALVEELSLVFRDGRVVDIEASVGKDDVAAWIEIDSGASMLGEIGLVGSDAALYGMTRYFDLPQFDENTASHVALGHGVSFTLRDADRLSDSDLASLGCNSSAIHTDICFGSPEVSIVATKTNRGEVMLLDGGSWEV